MTPFWPVNNACLFEARCTFIPELLKHRIEFIWFGSRNHSWFPPKQAWNSCFMHLYILLRIHWRRSLLIPFLLHQHLQSVLSIPKIPTPWRSLIIYSPSSSHPPHFWRVSAETTFLIRRTREWIVICELEFPHYKDSMIYHLGPNVGVSKMRIQPWSPTTAWSLGRLFKMSRPRMRCKMATEERLSDSLCSEDSFIITFSIRTATPKMRLRVYVSWMLYFSNGFPFWYRVQVLQLWF